MACRNSGEYLWGRDSITVHVGFTKNQARGSRKRKSGEMAPNETSVTTRVVVSWLFQHMAHSMTAIAQFCGLDYDFTRRWAQAESKRALTTRLGRAASTTVNAHS